MSSQPSFAALYRQSRYARVDDAPQQATRQNRRELFAVASVAFVMKHDPAFLQVFLKQVCGVSEPDLVCEFAVELQPRFHADLRIRCEARKALYIVEFKIRAKLMTKQNFSPKGEFLKKREGYGWKMLNEKEYADCLARTYVVLQNGHGFSDELVRGIRVRSRTWKHLVDNPATESALTSDLLDMLGAWNIASLRFRKTTGMKKARQTKHAAEIFQIVTAIAEEIGIRPKQYVFDVVSEPGDGSYFGLNIPYGLKRLSRLEKCAGKQEYALGWFGYSAAESGESTLDVWIYCKPSKATEPPLAKTQNFVKERLKGRSDLAIRSQDGSVRISVEGKSIPDDKEWFAGVIETLIEMK